MTWLWHLSHITTSLVLGLPPSCWAHLAGISGEEINYFVSSILLLFCPALSAAIKGRDWMDGGKAIWMTLPFWEVPSELIPRLQNAAGLNGLGYWNRKTCILLTTVCKTKIDHFKCVWRVRNGWMAADSVGCSCHFWNFQMRLCSVEFQYS